MRAESYSSLFLSQLIGETPAHDWASLKKESRRASSILSRAGGEFKYYGRVVETCADWAEYSFPSADCAATGSTGQRMYRSRAFLCNRPGYCPICRERKARLQRDRFLPAALQALQNGAQLFKLTLTVRNCSVSNLRQTLKKMGSAFSQLTRLDVFTNRLWGWAKATEIGVDTDGLGHPHFHAILAGTRGLCSPKAKTSPSAWVRMWRDALGVSYEPRVSIAPIRPAEVVRDTRYAFKFQLDKFRAMLDDEPFFLEQGQQLQRLPTVASRGILQGVESQRAEIALDRSETMMVPWDEQSGSYAKRVPYTFAPTA